MFVVSHNESRLGVCVTLRCHGYRGVKTKECVTVTGWQGHWVAFDVFCRYQVVTSRLAKTLSVCSHIT